MTDAPPPAWRACLLVFAVNLATMLWALGRAPLTNTEAHRVVTARQMVASGRWLVPRLYGTVYLRKPPLVYWTFASLEAATGIASPWIWRLPGAVASAALAAFLCWTGRRWFGPPAGLVAGFAFLGLAALWEQARNAEIDAMNGAAATVCAVSVLELALGGPRHRWPWALLCAAASGSMLLLKGPGGLPVILGALAGSAVAVRSWRPLIRSGVWIGLAGGLLLFAAWVVAIKLQLRADQADLSGVQEVGRQMTPSNADHVIRALMMPFTLAAYALPVSVGALAALLPAVRRAWSRPEGRLIRAVASTFLGATVVLALSMIKNPRYGYPTLPILCLPVGGLAVAWGRLRGTGASPGSRERIRPEPCEPASWFRFALLVLPILYLATGIGLAAAAWKRAPHPELLIALLLVALVACLYSIRSSIRRRTALAAWALVVVVAVASIASGIRKDGARRRQHARKLATVRMLLDAVPNDATLTIGRMAQGDPGLLYYAEQNSDITIRRPRADLDPPLDDVPPGLLFLHHDEWARWGANYKQLVRSGSLTVEHVIEERGHRHRVCLWKGRGIDD
jgi:hypothetical protein